MNICRVSGSYIKVTRLSTHTLIQSHGLRTNQSCTKESRRARQFETITDGDFFGIDYVTNKDVAGANTSVTVDGEKINKIYEPLLGKRFTSAVVEKETLASYGFIRKDIDNIPSEHGMFEKNAKPTLTRAEIKMMFNSSQVSPSVGNELGSPSEQTYLQQNKISGIVPDEDFYTVISSFESESDSIGNMYKIRKPLSFKFKYSKVSNRPGEDQQMTFPESGCKAKFDSKTIEDIDQLEAEILSTKNDSAEVLVFDIEKDKEAHRLLEKEEGHDDIDPFSVQQEVSDNEFDNKLEQSIAIKDANGKQISALKYLKSVRSGLSKANTKELKSKMDAGSDNLYSTKERIDSKGYIDYSSQVPDYSKFRRSEIFELIKSSVVYHNYDIVAINKPYGLSCHGGGSSDDEYTNLNCYLTDLAKSLRVTKLHLVHRIDKSTTGLLVLAATREKANSLNKQLAAGDIKKVYWCVTKDVPSPSRGIIDIPIEEFKVDGKSRQCLRPELIENLRHLTKRKDESKRAITEYKVLSSHGSAALVEARPKTGIKHQIRCHLGFGLRAPILGDHKYSHITKILPQKLAADLLLRLNVRQAKVRTIPMHLHAKSMMLPQAKANGEDVFLSAPIPKFFRKNLKSLKLLDRELNDQCS